MNQPRVTLRIGTWNLAGRWSDRHEAALAAADCDVWLLTEVRFDTAIDGYQPHFSAGFMATDRHWAGLLFRQGLDVDGWDPDPHPASAAATVDGITYCSSILPWRSCGTQDPWEGETYEAKTAAATRDLATALPSATTVWGGDWNHALTGPERAGSRAGRDHINRTLDVARATRGDHRARTSDRRPTHHRPHRGTRALRRAAGASHRYDG